MDTVIETTSRRRRTLDPKPATPVLFAHFVLRSSNIQPMIDWYSAVLNMHVVQRTDYICFLTYDDEHHRLGIVNLAGLTAPDARTRAWRTSPTPSPTSARCSRPTPA